MDIQPHGLQIVQLQHQRRGYRIKHMISVGLPLSVFAEGKIKQWDVLSGELAEIVSAHGLNGMQVAIHVPAHLVRMQQVQMPLGMSDEEIEADIQRLLKRELPGMADALCIDFHVLSQQKGYINVHFTAARQEYISQYIECVQAAGLSVAVIDIDIYALARVVSLAGTANAILYINKKQAIFIVCDAQNILFHQHWDVDESGSFSGQLKQRIQLYHATGAVKLNQLVLCGSPHDLAIVTLDAVQEWAIPLHYLDPYSHIKNIEKIANAADFMLAFGLAIREAST